MTKSVTKHSAWNSQQGGNMSKRMFRQGQWVIKTEEDSDGNLTSFRIYNPGTKVRERFYAVYLGQYGQPLIESEPTLGFKPPVNLLYVNGKGQQALPDNMITGVICKGGLRASLTSAQEKGIKVSPNRNNSIQVGDEVWWISTLFLKDKNRFSGYDAFLVRDQPDVVRILELGDLNLY